MLTIVLIYHLYGVLSTVLRNISIDIIPFFSENINGGSSIMENNIIVTIGRQYGSGGRIIGKNYLKTRFEIL